MSKKLVLIDGHSILNRAFYGVPNLTNSEGLHTNAVYGFLNILFKILDEEQAEYLIVAFDAKQPTFRHEMYQEYKGTRKPMPEELREQVPIIKEVLQAMNIKIMELPGYEADDVLGTIAKMVEKEGFEVSLVSGDRDLLQIASENIKIRIPKTKGSKTEIEDYNTKDVIEKYQIEPQQIIDLKGLMGDAADNIPGVPGIGEKTATKIITAFGSVENALEHIDEVMPIRAREKLKEHYDLAVLSKKLAAINIESPVDFQMEEARINNLYNEEAFVWLKRLEFKSMIARFDCDVKHNDNIEEEFLVSSELKEAQAIFKEALQQSYIGMNLVLEDGELLGMALSFEGHKGIYFPAEDSLSVSKLVEQVNTLVKKQVKISLFNLKESLPVLGEDTVQEGCAVYDLAVAGYLLNPLKDSYEYDDIARDYLGLTVPSRNELLGKKRLKSELGNNTKEAVTLVCYEAYIAYEAFKKISLEIKEKKMEQLFLEVEMPLVYTLYEMETRGIRVNKEELKAYGDRLETRIRELEKTIYDLVGETFNINSPKQLGVILFEKLKLPFAKKTKTGYSTSADILEKLRSEDPVIGMILEYRQLTKLKSTYADGLAVYIRPEDERIHGKFNQTITATGRISSTEPNLQNIPIRMELGREIRKVFIPRDGYVFLDADYSQIELRVLAHMSKDERLIEAYRQEQDIHKITASEVFHTPLSQVTGIQRSNAKAVNFGIVYGISSFGLGQDLNITRKEAESYIKKYFETYPKVKEYLDRLVEDAKKYGYVTTLFGRIRPVPELSSSNFMQRSFGERIAMNSPIQGTAADIIKIAMVKVNQRLKKANLESSLILQIHDELLIETKKEEIETVRSILIEEMHQAADLSVPLEIDINQGNSWYEAK